MFSIGFFEVCVIAVGILIFVGPKRLPELMRQAGRFFVQARRMTNEVRSGMETVIQDAEMDMLKKEAQKRLAEVDLFANSESVEVKKHAPSSAEPTN